MMEIINSFDYNSKEYEAFLRNLLYFNNDIPFNVEEVDTMQCIIVSAINNQLNRSQTRYTGLSMLDKISLQCSKDTLSKYCMLWMSKAAQLLDNVHSNQQELSVCCKVLGCLISRTKDIADIQKQISTQNIKQLVNIIGNLDAEKRCGSVYYLIAVLLYHYPEVCAHFQASIRKILLSQIDSSQGNVVKASARCYALLIKCNERSFKPPTTKSHYTTWTYNQALICNSLHAIMDELFVDLIEVENVEIWDKLDLPNISEEHVVEFYFKKKQRFTNLCSYLSYMLCGFDKKNMVYPHEILSVLCRGLAVKPSNLKGHNSVKEQMLYLILPQLHIALFDVLETLINSFKGQLISFGSTILRLFLQTLQWTENVLQDQATLNGSKPFKSTRISAYKCLNTWLINNGTLSGIETIADEYLPFILKDIIPEKDRVLLTIQKTQSLSKRALKRLRDSQYEKGTFLNNGISSTKEHYLDIDTCKIALSVLESIFFNSGTLLKPAFFKTVQNTIIPLLYDCYLSSAHKKFYKENPECRLLLFRLLRALQMNPHSLIPPPTQYSLEIFEMALNDSYLDIIKEAKVALAELEKIVHPYAPPIQITQVETVQEKFIGDKETIEEHGEDAVELFSTSVEADTDVIVDPSPNKRLKVANTRINEISEPIAENIEDGDLSVSLRNREEEDSVIKNDNLTAKETVQVIQDKNKNQKLTETYSKSFEENSTEKAINNELETMELTLSSTDILKQNEDVAFEDIETAKENTRIGEIISETSTKSTEHLSAENEQEEEEILKLFHDIPRSDK